MDYNWLVKLLVDVGCRVRSYSGRGMYGKQCLALVVEEGSGMSPAGVMSFVADILDSPIDFSRGELAQVFRGAREDSMGLGTVIYFPQVEWQARWGEDIHRG